MASYQQAGLHRISRSDGKRTSERRHLQHETRCRRISVRSEIPSYWGIIRRKWGITLKMVNGINTRFTAFKFFDVMCSCRI